MDIYSWLGFEARPTFSDTYTYSSDKMKFSGLSFILLFALYRLGLCQVEGPRCSASQRKVKVGTLVKLGCSSTKLVSKLTLTKDSNILGAYTFAKAVEYDYVVTENDHNSKFTCMETSLVDGTSLRCSIKLKLVQPGVEIKQSDPAVIGSNVTLTCSGTDIIGIYTGTLWNIPVYFLHPKLRAVVDKKRTHVLQLFDIKESDDRVVIACSLKSTGGTWNASRKLNMSSIALKENVTSKPTSIDVTNTTATTLPKKGVTPVNTEPHVTVSINANQHNLSTIDVAESSDEFDIPFFWIMFICATTGFTVSFCSVYLLIRCICSSKHRGGDEQSSWMFRKCADRPSIYATTITRSEQGSLTSNKPGQGQNFYITCANDISAYDTIKCTGNEYLEPTASLKKREINNSLRSNVSFKYQVNTLGVPINTDYQGNNDYLEPMCHKQLNNKSVTDTVYSVPFGE